MAKQTALNSSTQTCTPSPSSMLIENPINILELDSCLESVKGKTPGYDRISYPMLRNAPLVAKRRILALYNEILDQGIIPQSWKIASIVPILKPKYQATDIK